MSSHADTIQDFQCELDRIGVEVGASAARTWMWQNRELVLDSLDALLAENQRLRDALERIAKSGSYAHDRPTTLFAATDIAREALAGDAE